MEELITQKDLLAFIVKFLRDHKIPYMISGGVAASFWGKPRSTHDFDIVVHISKVDISKFKPLLDQSFYLSETAASEAIEEGTMFNLIHDLSGLKIDLWPLKRTEYDQTRFKRKIRKKFWDCWLQFISPEDLIVSKLLWIKEGASFWKHSEDIKNIMEIQKGKLDQNYISKWNKKLDLEPLF